MLHRHDNCIKENEEGNSILKVSMIHQVEKDLLAILRLIDLDPELLALSNFLDLDPRPLLLSHKHVSEFLLLFDGVEVINNHTNEEVNNELRANNHKSHEEDD